MTKDGSDHGTWKGNGIGTMSGNGKTSFLGAIYFGNTPAGKLEFLNNVVGVYDMKQTRTEIHQPKSGNGSNQSYSVSNFFKVLDWVVFALRVPNRLV